MKLSRILTLAAALFATALPAPAEADKLRDLADVLGARDNQLVGYGVVVGLNGTGDDASAPLAAQSLRALMRRLGVQVDDKQLRLRNVAAVLVTANVPAFSRNGARLDVTVASAGNARSLRGGVLIQTPLRGADRRTYAVAQGPLIVGGISASGPGASMNSGVSTTGRIASGALIEREIQTEFSRDGKVTLVLRNADFATAQRVVEALDAKFGKGSARALDGGSIEVKAPAALAKTPVAFVSALSELDVDPSTPARVVINERTGTVVAGGDVRLSPVAIAQGGITVNIRNESEVSQPAPFGGGKTTVVPRADVQTDEPQNGVSFVPAAATLADVAQALSQLGVTPRELASILQALKTAGALRAEIIVQ